MNLSALNMENISPCHGCGKSLSDFLSTCPSCGFVKPQPLTSRQAPDNWKPASPAGPKEDPPQPERKGWRLEERPQPSRQMVVVTDIHMEFGSMVTFLVKLVLAAIPAFAILAIFFVVVVFLLGLRH